MVSYIDKTIDSVSDYLFWVKETNTSEIECDNGESISLYNDYGYYRGQSVSEWVLKPSILREPLLDEHSLLNKALLRLHNDISFLRTNLEKLIFFQHYGLSTRLLDVTFNPLVALYMACCEENKQSFDGVVYCGHNSDCSNSQIAELTAKYVFEHEIQQRDFGLQNFAKTEGVLVDLFCQPLFILPPINNPRIEAQNGAFIMAPLIEKIIDSKTVLVNRKDLGNSGFFDKRRAIIKGQNKSNILHELSVLGIDSGTIFKGTEEKLKAIVAEEKWCFNRFILY